MGNPRAKLSRRQVLQKGSSAVAATAMTAVSYRRVWGANERIRLGMIGFGLIGKRHLLDFSEQADAQIVGIAEAHQGRRDEAVALAGDGCSGQDDFRQLLDRTDVDAVVISTPDHWHALQTMLACAAEKDVYIEKPVTLFPREGDWMLQVAHHHKRVVQVGTQQRSGAHYAEARQLIQSGAIGKVVSVRVMSARNIRNGFGQVADANPPTGFDYDMWLGPAPKRPYNELRTIYHFRWYWDYSGGQMTNLGQHSLDVVDWVLGMEGCRSVCSFGGRFALTDGSETPDVQDALFHLGDWTLAFSHRECAQGVKPEYPLTFYGTRGSLAISRSGFTVTPDKRIDPRQAIPQFTGAHPIGGPEAVTSRGTVPLLAEGRVNRAGNDRQQFKDHARNFLDCIKTRNDPVSSLASGVRVATLCHLANISLRTGQLVRWDDKLQRSSHPEVNSWLERPYRPPWDAVRDSLLRTVAVAPTPGRSNP